MPRRSVASHHSSLVLRGQTNKQTLTPALLFLLGRSLPCLFASLTGWTVPLILDSLVALDSRGSQSLLVADASRRSLPSFENSLLTGGRSSLSGYQYPHLGPGSVRVKQRD